MPPIAGHRDAAAPEGGEHVPAADRVVGAAPVVHDVPQARDVPRILADDHGAEVLLDEGGERALVAGAPDRRLRLSVADETALGLDPHEGAVERRGLPEVAAVLALLRNGHVEPRRGHRPDLHLAFAPPVGALESVGVILHHAGGSPVPVRQPGPWGRTLPARTPGPGEPSAPRRRRGAAPARGRGRPYNRRDRGGQRKREGRACR